VRPLISSAAISAIGAAGMPVSARDLSISSCTSVAIEASGHAPAANELGAADVLISSVTLSRALN
jgi:hypothetical protein